MIVGELLKQPTHDIGFNAQTGEYVNMIQQGNILPSIIYYHTTLISLTLFNNNILHNNLIIMLSTNTIY